MRFFSAVMLCMFLSVVQAATIQVTEQPPKSSLSAQYKKLQLKAPVAVPSINIEAKSWILVAFPTGKILSEHNAHQALPPASLTKLMSALLASEALEQGRVSLKTSVDISVKAWRTRGSRMFVREGTEVPFEALLKGMIIQSGNDATVAVAEHLAGSTEKFASLMNQKAQQMGLKETHFVNPHGLPDKGHVSSAHDIAMIAMSIIQDHPELYHYYDKETYTWNDIKQYNRNRLLRIDEDIDGLKTGYTKEAGYCLAASGKEGDTRLIAVVFGTKSAKKRTAETQKLLDWGFDHFAYEQLLESEQALIEIPTTYSDKRNVMAGIGSDVWKVLPKGEYDRVKLRIEMPEQLKAPVTVGRELGKVDLLLDDEVLDTQPLIAKESAPLGSLYLRIKDWVHEYIA